jgi:hypothetical protein
VKTKKQFEKLGWFMKESAPNTYQFRLGRAAYIRTSLLALLLLSSFLLCGLVATILGLRLFSTYAHTFTFYLKWQDVLVALCWYITFISLGGCAFIIRFLHALHAGYHKEMIVVSTSALIVRDLSHENLSSIFWYISTALTCFLTALVGLIPEVLLAWTVHLPSPMLAVLASGVTLVLGLAGLALTLPFLSFIIVGIVGSISFCRKMGSPQTYHLTTNATLSIDRFVLTIIYPDRPESMIDLNILEPDDQSDLLNLLRERWNGTQRIWNPRLGEEIELALIEAARPAVLV